MWSEANSLLFIYQWFLLYTNKNKNTRALRANMKALGLVVSDKIFENCILKT